MPVVLRHTAVESWLLDAARAYLTRTPRSGIHVSDLISPRKAYWARVLPRPPSDREVGFFLAGRGHEDALMAVSRLGRHRKVKGAWEGISYEVDAVGVDASGTEVPVELKTTRKPTILDASQVLEEYDLAVAQLASYAAALGKTSAYLIEFHLMARGSPDDSEQGWIRQSSPAIVVYQLDWTEAELETVRTWMRLRRDLIQESWRARDHTILPECKEWQCGKEFVRLHAPRCPECGKVYPVGEEREDGTRSGVKKKCDCGAKLVRDQETVWVPSCRWHLECWPSGNWPSHYPPKIDAGRQPVVESASEVSTTP